MMSNYFWDAESWGMDYPPENWQEIVWAANQEIDTYMQESGLDVYDDDVKNFSENLWESWMVNGNLPEYLRNGDA